MLGPHGAGLGGSVQSQPCWKVPARLRGVALLGRSWDSRLRPSQEDAGVLGSRSRLTGRFREPYTTELICTVCLGRHIPVQGTL